MKSNGCSTTSQLTDSAETPDMPESTDQPVPVGDANLTNIDVTFTVPFTHRLRQTSDVSGDDSDCGVLESVLLADTSDASAEKPKVLFWCDSNLTGNCKFSTRLAARLHASERIRLMSDPYVIMGGECCKNSDTVLEELLLQINEHELDRRSYIVVAGGGAVLDVAGYAAAIAHRGVRLVRLPSTTLAQADSGVGVKNAINHFEKKNWVGTFAVPWAVINDAAILESLPDRDFHSGFTEAVKVALLKDVSFFDYLRENAAALRSRDLDVSTQVIAKSCRWHLDHITLGGDPFEALEARPLDFGHWSAHRLEPMTNYQLRHGEAVGIGVALDTLYSARKFGFPRERAIQVCETLAAIGAPIWCDTLSRGDEVLRGLEEFRQHLGGRLTVTMLSDVGKPINVHEIDLDDMKASIEELQDIATSQQLGESAIVGV